MGKRKKNSSNVVEFRTRAEREAEQRAKNVVQLPDAQVIPFPSDRVASSRALVFNLPEREDADGQLALDFDGLWPRGECKIIRLPGCERRAYDLYVRASQLDEDPATYGEAAALYEEALRFDPRMAIAEVNLANLHFRRGNVERAETLYRHSIAIQHHNPEGHYNLGYVLLERGDARGAARSFETAIGQDPRFADAHFNLAMALEQMGERGGAREHWLVYLDLEPHGTWADIARSHVR